MYDNTIAWMIGQADDRARERASRQHEARALLALSEAAEGRRRSWRAALTDRIARLARPGRREATPASCAA